MNHSAVDFLVMIGMMLMSANIALQHYQDIKHPRTLGTYLGIAGFLLVVVVRLLQFHQIGTL